MDHVFNSTDYHGHKNRERTNSTMLVVLGAVDSACLGAVDSACLGAIDRACLGAVDSACLERSIVPVLESRQCLSWSGR
jgi:hypothetical protein